MRSLKCSLFFNSPKRLLELEHWIDSILEGKYKKEIEVEVSNQVAFSYN